jgi:23S rRNA pseudouridine1911/1915/1917 synthase
VKSQLVILARDASLLAIDKPSGLAVLPGRGRDDSLLQQVTRELAPENITPLPVHRIDADTSGLVIFALTRAAQRALSGQFLQRTVTKEYLALVRGNPLHATGTIDLPLGPDPKDKTRMIIHGKNVKAAISRWEVEQAFRGLTLLRVFPETGRRHQIRVHLKAIGYPLAVDPLYGGEPLRLSEFKRNYKIGKWENERPMIARLTLHAHRLRLTHPETDLPLELEAPLPKDFRATIASLGRWATNARA